MIQCPRCNTQNENSQSFCKNCGNSLTQPAVCPQCHAPLAPGASFCGACGHSLNATSTAQLPDRLPPHQPMNFFALGWHEFSARYADFSGRTSIRAYWALAVLMFAAFMVAATIVAVAFLATQLQDSEKPVALLGVLFLVLALLWLATIVPGIAVVVRRFHDQGKSGWFSLLSFIPGIGGIIIIVMMCMAGQPGRNQYGDPPL